MKYLLLISLWLHGPSGQFTATRQFPEVDLLQVRVGSWPINFQRFIYYTDTCYAIQFRDQHAMNGVLYKTLDLETLEQLKYFREGLITLKKGNNGDIAEFKNYSLKKVSEKKNDAWYILTYDGAITNFQEAQVNRMIFIINDLIASKHKFNQ
jgi:hypothetical protein